jgi:hypothetical protein
MVPSRLEAQENIVMLTNCSDVSLSVFAYRIFDILPGNEGGTLARCFGEDAKASGVSFVPT